MDYYQSLKSFIKVVEQESFSGAARKLHCSISSISKQITWLEQQFNATLFIRNTRSLVITNAGNSLYEFSKKFFMDFDALKNSIQEDQHQLVGRITITAPHKLGVDIIGPCLPKFSAKFPKINFNLLLNNKLMHLDENDIDISIRTLIVKDSSYLYETINIPTFRRGVFVSKQYLKKYGLPKKPEDLEKHNCLMHSEEKNMYRWEFNNNEQVMISGTFQSNNVNALINAAKQHLGCIYIYYYQVEAEIKNGDLVEILSDYANPPQPMYVCYINQNPIPQKITTFISFLKDKLLHR